jgi:glycosyltransferase involved in cell wall biosynthesis
MIKVLVPVTYGELGGSQVFLLKLMDAMRSDPEIRFSVWLGQNGPLEGELSRRGIPCRRPCFSMSSPFRIFRMVRELKKEHPDVIYLHASRMLALAARLAGIPCVERINMSREGDAAGWCNTPWIDRIFTSFNTRALAVSEAIRRQLIRRGVPDEKILVIRNFVELDRFARPGESIRMELRRELGLKPEEIAVLNVGRFMPQKAQDDSLRIAAESVKTNPNLRFFLLGDGELRSRLEQLTDELGIRQFVTFLPFRKDTEKVYAAADILLHTAHWDPLANVLLEAMAASLPVIATDVDGTAEVILDGQTGRLFKKEDVNAGAAILRELAADPALRKKLGDNARSFSEEHLSKQTVVSQFKEMFKTLQLNNSEGKNH